MSMLLVGIMELVVNYLEYDYGIFWIGVYELEDIFLDWSKVDLYVIKVCDLKSKKIYFNNLVYGDYVVVVFYDLNDNGEMDFNWMGVL